MGFDERQIPSIGASQLITILEFISFSIAIQKVKPSILGLLESRENALSTWSIMLELLYQCDMAWGSSVCGTAVEHYGPSNTTGWVTAHAAQTL